MSDALDNIELPDFGTRHIVAELQGRVLRLRIDRTERRNAFTQDMYRALKRAAIWSDDQPELDAVYLTGTGDWFASGGDMGGNAEDTEGLAAEWDPTDHFPFRHIERCSKLWVAAVNGACHAGGLNLTLYSDLSIAADTATFRVPELLRGIPDGFMSSRLAEFVGLARARYLLFTASEISAAEAFEMGLVGKVVPAAELDTHVDWVLGRVAETGPQARSAVKGDMFARLPRTDVEMFRRAIRSDEMVEGMTAFLQKRPANWPR
jgi:enoyl-CoA hydratase/carnithine racemase